MAELKEFVLGIGPDVKLGIPITSVGPPTAIDLTTVSSVTLIAKRQDRSTKPPWTGTLVPSPGNSVVTPTAATIQYPFQTTDLDQQGVWRVSIRLNLNDGNFWWTEPNEVLFRVVDPYSNR